MNDGELIIRPGTVDDFPACQALDHHYRTTRVWQLDCQASHQVQTARFQTVRLPRPLTVPYPHPLDKLVERWYQAHVFLIAEDAGAVLGYLTLMVDPLDPVAWINDLVITGRRRRQGIGSNLLSVAAHWARERPLHRLMARVQTKNDPAIRFLKKNGLTFCGYNEHQFHGDEITLYFSARL